MKLRLLAIILFVTSTLFSQNFHDTQGKLDISNAGQATYTLPIAMPPSLKDIGPIINLSYVSGQMGGIAGQGWSINSISYISRMATRKDVDGYVDGVDFDDNDKLSFDGQRLILVPETGDYWSDGSIYQTEVQSNTKIQLFGSGTNIYFVVTAPDGSRSWYGNYGGTNATDLTAFYITRFEDTNGNYMTYHYSNPFSKSLCISEIKFSGNDTSGIAPMNSIVFNYKLAKRSEFAYIKGVKHEKVALLDYIEVKTIDNGQSKLFRKYQLTHIADEDFGYEKVSQLQEFNGNLEPANPVLFEYNNTVKTTVGAEIMSPYFNNLYVDKIQASGDFDGDGRLDFISSNYVYTKLFGGITESIATGGWSLSEHCILPITTLTDNKLNQFQSLLMIDAQSTNSIRFRIKSLKNDDMTIDYTKLITIPNYGNCYSNCPVNQCDGNQFVKNSNLYYEGDYNGDGISEVLILGFQEEKNYTYTGSGGGGGGGGDPNGKTAINTNGENVIEPIENCAYTYWKNTTVNLTRLLDLNPNSSTTLGTSGYVEFSSSNFTADKRQVGDFNGDGKSDILLIENTDKSYKIVGFKQLTTAPWVELEIIGQGTLEDYSPTKQMMFGDYNGDGKTDIMLPHYDGGGCTECDLWYIYYGNPKPGGGSFFEKESHNIVEYRPDTGSFYSSQRLFNNYYSMDVNGDGKTDLVRVFRRLYDTQGTANDYNTQWQVSTYVNQIGNTQVTGNKFKLDYVSFTPNMHDDESPDLPTPIVASYRYHNLNREIFMVRKNSHYITYVDFTKDVSKDVLLQKVTSSGGNVVNEITYKSMEPSSGSNNGLGELNEFYSSGNAENYPNAEVIKLPTNNLVLQLKNTTEGVIKFQDFRYHGYMVNLHGIGALGFKKTARSAWYLTPGEKRIWSVTESSSLWRGGTKRIYTQLSMTGSDFSFVESGDPIGIINSAVNDFEFSTTNSVFAIYLENQTSTDFITGVSNSTDYEYDPTYFIPTKTISKNLLGGVVQGTTTVSNFFDHNISGTGSSYYIGRPTSTITAVSAYSNTFESSVEYSYINNRLSKTKKKGNTTASKFIVEEFDYFDNGNIKKKTVSSEGYVTPSPINARSVEYTYDPSGRYIKTVKDHEGLISTNDTFDPLYGIVLKTTNPFGLATKTVVDSWGKTLKITDYLDKSIVCTYSRSGFEFTTTKTGDDGSSNMAVCDALGQTKKTGVKNINDTWSYKNTEYDFLGRKTRESEPYSAGGANYWSTTAYDEYGRTTNNVNATGLTTSFTYSGLTTTGTDGNKTTTVVKNANGHVVSTTDNGGTINYEYYANGNLKKSIFEGTVIEIEYDEWGNKSKLTDPSAGPYEYKYYPTGETYQETTPKGTTTYTLDLNTGKLINKKILGENTNTETTYSYHPTTKLLTGSSFEDTGNTGHINYAYEYNSYNQIEKIIETNVSNAVFEHTYNYDSYGRPYREFYKATSNGKESSKWIRNTYKNGAHWQILDDATNGVLWQVDNVNARGQVTEAHYGNGTDILNSYDQYGYPTQIRHDYFDDGIIVNGQAGGMVNTMTLSTSFNTQRGNLNSRTSNLFGGIAVTEDFKYDSLDRLTEWADAVPPILHNNTFSSGVNDFTGVNGGTVLNAIGKLRINTSAANAGGHKVIMTNAPSGAKVKVSVTIFKNTTNKIRIVAVEVNPTTGVQEQIVLGNVTADGTYVVEHIVRNEKSNLYIRFDKSETSTDVGVSTYFMIDNLFITRINKETQQYDNKGRITQNTLGTYNYANTSMTPPKLYQNSSILPTPQALGYYNTRPLQEVSYNVFKSPVEIKEDGIDKISFNYNDANGRSIMYYGGLEAIKTDRTMRKYYDTSGSMEIKHNTDTGALEFITYIGGDGYSAPVVLKSNGTTQQYLYLHRDYQGSIVAITDGGGRTLEKRLFDAWGAIVKVEDGLGNSLGKLTLLDRGYTGHEHLESVGLIHMNGRLYDAKIHRFLQPDNFIQDPNNTQNYNRYSYVLNNPLKYTDPSGESYELGAAVVIAVAVAAITYTLTSLYSAAPFSAEGIVKSVVIAAASAVITYGIGTLTGNIGNFFVKAGVQALAHGTVQGGFTAVQGGNFWTGFAAGAISSIACSAFAGGTNTEVNSSGVRVGIAGTGFNSIGDNLGGVGMIAFGTLAGGAGAYLTGGNFWQGAVTGLFVSGLNHAMHMTEDPGKKPKPKKESTKNFVKRILANQKKDFFGANISLDSYNSPNNWTAFGTIHTSEVHFYNYLTQGLTSPSGMLLMHEYGHFLHASYDPLNFYSYAVFSSATTANYSWAGTNWTEIKANTMSYYYFGQPKGWDFANYPVNSNYLSPELINNLTNHTKP